MLSILHLLLEMIILQAVTTSSVVIFPLKMKPHFGPFLPLCHDSFFFLLQVSSSVRMSLMSLFCNAQLSDWKTCWNRYIWEWTTLSLSSKLLLIQCLTSSTFSHFKLWAEQITSRQSCSVHRKCGCWWTHTCCQLQGSNLLTDRKAFKGSVCSNNNKKPKLFPYTHL